MTISVALSGWRRGPTMDRLGPRGGTGIAAFEEGTPDRCSSRRSAPSMPWWWPWLPGRGRPRRGRRRRRGRGSEQAARATARTTPQPDRTLGMRRHAPTLSEPGLSDTGSEPGARASGIRRQLRLHAALMRGHLFGGAPRAGRRPFLRGRGSLHGEQMFVSMGAQAEPVGAMSHPVRRVTTQVSASTGQRGERDGRRTGQGTGRSTGPDREAVRQGLGHADGRQPAA